MVWTQKSPANRVSPLIMEVFTPIDSRSFTVRSRFNRPVCLSSQFQRIQPSLPFRLKEAKYRTRSVPPLADSVYS